MPKTKTAPTKSTTAADRREYWRAKRAKERGGPPRELKPHGTLAALRRHERAHETPCAACLKARSDHQAKMAAQRKALQLEAQAERERRNAARRAKAKAARKVKA